ncbi:hypothetical protein SAMN05421788_102283 [Filimonas lacunae]|uniref:Uncharacterized protein n=2 Tax=Filimonas lacunae TaxID=477680 RepID=A0A1N7N9X8_9BACT|nr:hypothetical protein SAMN05421788_102283 [Filimonas lacunae]
MQELSEEEQKFLEKYRELSGAVLKFSEVMQVLVGSIRVLLAYLPENMEERKELMERVHQLVQTI